MPSTLLFSTDEKVLCFHHELLYEAKVTDQKLSDPSDKKSDWLYRIHYKGWKNTWDDWVPQDRLRKFNQENIELARNLKKEMEAIRNPKPIAKPNNLKRPGDGSSRGSEERNSIQGKKRVRDFEAEREDQYNSKPAVRIPIPDALKSILVDDWENITKNHQLVHLPANYSVHRILDDYLNRERPKRHESISIDILEEVIAGLKEYFNTSVGRILLYKFERAQYSEIISRTEKLTDDMYNKKLGEIYGAEHLLRLFVNLPELIAQTNMDKQSVMRLREEIYGFLTWLSKIENLSKYCSTPYEGSGTDYKERFQKTDDGQLIPLSEANANAIAEAEAEAEDTMDIDVPEAETDTNRRRSTRVKATSGLAN